MINNKKTIKLRCGFRNENCFADMTSGINKTNDMISKTRIATYQIVIIVNCKPNCDKTKITHATRTAQITSKFCLQTHCWICLWCTGLCVHVATGICNICFSETTWKLDILIQVSGIYVKTYEKSLASRTQQLVEHVFSINIRACKYCTLRVITLQSREFRLCFSIKISVLPHMKRHKCNRNIALIHAHWVTSTRSACEICVYECNVVLALIYNTELLK